MKTSNLTKIMQRFFKKIVTLRAPKAVVIVKKVTL